MWQLTDEDGLPSMEVYDTHQDTKGYIWFATELGVCRYDGNTFKRYATPTARSKAMSNFREDRKGKIWFMNFSRQIFYIENDQVKELPLPPDLIKYRILDMLISVKNNRLYVLNSRDIFEYDPLSKKWGLFSKQLPGVTMWRSMAQDYEGNIWYTQNQNSLCMHTPGKKPVKISITQGKLGENIIFLGKMWSINKRIESISVLQHNLLKVSSIAKHKKLQNVVLTQLTRDREGNYWITSYDGAHCFNADHTPYRGGLHILPEKAISNIIQDREGNYWITTLRSGVYFMPSKEVLYYNRENSNLEDSRVNTVAVDDDGSILIGVSSGQVPVLNPKKGVIFQYDTGHRKDVEALYYDNAKKQLYVSSFGFRIFKKNTKKPWNFLQSTHNINQGSPGKGIAGSAPKNFASFGADHLLSASSTGINLVRLSPRPNEYLPLNSKFRKGLGYKKTRILPSSKNTVYKMYRFNLRPGRARAVWGDTINHRIWAGYFDGLFYYNEDGIARKIIDQQNKHGLYALSITQGPDGLVWVGTMEHGLYGIRDTTIVYHYNTNNGLVSNYCKVIRPDGHKVWLGTDQGIQLIDPETSTFRLFNRQDGLITNEIRDLIVQGDKIWVATTKGLLVFNKTEMRKNNAYPPIYITKVAIWDKEVPLKDAYTLDYNQNNLSISFKGLAYRSRGKFRYKYRMIGLDSNWMYTNSSTNYVRYPSIPPGTYEFEVKAVNEDNVESEGIAVIQIKVYKHYTQTWWFITLVILGIVAIITLFFLLRIQNLKRESGIKQALRSSQLSALKVQMNPHFIFNALNSIQEFILLNEKRMANAFLGKFADLMRFTLDMSNESLISLSEELKVLRLYLELEAIRFEDTFQYHIEVSASIDPEEIQIPSMLIQPYVENAIKHGLLHKKNERVLWVRFTTQKNEMLCCEVEDNGIGRKKSWKLKNQRKTKHKSFAMSATQKRLELLNHGRKNAILINITDLTDENGIAQGTKVHLKIPIDSSFN